MNKAVIDCQKLPDSHKYKDDCDKTEPKQPGLDFLCPNRVDLKQREIIIQNKDGEDSPTQRSLASKLFTPHSSSKSRFLKSFNGTFANAIKHKNGVSKF